MKKTGRNDPCPCGSGKKLKQCCGSLQNKETLPATPLKASIQESLQMGMAHHQAGHLSQADAIYRQILREKPNHPDALYLSGLIAHNAGQHEIAVELISKAISINPVGPFYYTLGNVFHALGRLEEAAESFRQALRRTPDMVEAHLNLAITLRAQDKLDLAAKTFHKALALDPDLVEAHLNLGNILKAQGKLDAAIEGFRKVLKLKPDYAEAHNNIGNIFQDQGKLDEAIASYHQAISLKPDYAEAHNNLGSALQAQGKSDEAVESFRQALVFKPDFAEAGNNLGGVLKDQGRLEAAIACCREAVKLKPDLVGAHSNLGNALREQGDPDAAIESLDKALALEPGCIGAHAGLAAVYQDTGQFDTARIHLDQVLALEPDHPAAWAVLAYLRKMTLDDRPWAEKAQRLLKSRLKPQEEMRLSYALGKYHDDTRQYEAAFPYYERANRLKRQLVGPFDRDKFHRFIDRIITDHPVEIVRQRQAGSSDSRRPLFIAGMPRSGTSLTEQILASHPDVFGAGELRFWGKQAQEHGAALASGCHDAALLRDIASRCEAELLRHSTSALRVVDKMPGNFLYLGLIHAVFPQARILHTRRNPIDTCLSIYFQNFINQHEYANDLDDLAFYYREYRRLMAHWRAVLPPEVFLDVPYEEVVEDQEGWSRRMIDFIGLEWDERCLNFHETERKVGTASNWQVRQKIYKTSKERWRNYEQFVAPLLPLLELAD